MSFGDSAAVFKARATEIGLTDDEFKKLEAQGLTTMAAFAFCCHFNPSASDEKPLVDLVTKVLTTAPTLKQMSCFRRLFRGVRNLLWARRTLSRALHFSRSWGIAI